MDKIVVCALFGAILLLILCDCEENRLLAELRDAMLPELMNGKLVVEQESFMKEILLAWNTRAPILSESEMEKLK